MKLQLQELKLQAEEDPKKVRKWRLGINEKQKRFEPAMERLHEAMQRFQEEESKAREEERAKECEKELALERMKLQQD